MSTSPFYKGVPLKFNRGVYTSKDPTELPDGSPSQALNVILDVQGQPTKIEGIQAYNTSAIATAPIQGMVSFLGEDNNQYVVVACNGYLWYSSGNGVFSQVKYLNDNVPITINTTNFFYRFVVFSEVISGTQKVVVYCVCGNYPVSTVATGTHNLQSTHSRALRLQVNSGAIIGLNIYYDATGSMTGGSDDIMVGQSTTPANNVAWPLQGLYVAKIYDRIVIANYAGANNGYICSQAELSDQSGSWTDVNANNSADVGGGKYPEPFTGIITYNSSLLIFSRHSILNVQAVPGPLSSWRETFIPTKLGAINQESIVLHSDGWVYFVAEEGISRTNGSIAERVDWNIQDQISTLTQLQQNAFNITLNTSSDWNAGTPSNGDNLLSTTNGTLTQLIQNTITQFQAGTYDSNYITIANNSISLTTIADDGTITNPSFETGDFTGWTANNDWAVSTKISNLSPYSGSYLAGYSYLVTSLPSIYLTINILKNSSVINTISPSLVFGIAWSTWNITPTANLGDSIQIQIIAYNSVTGHTNTLTGNTFIYCGGVITVPYVFGYLQYTQPFNHNIIYNAVDDVSQNPSTYSYNNSPQTYISSVYDFGVAPTTYGSLATLATIDAGGNIAWSFQTSSDNTNWNTAVSLGTQTASTFSANFSGTPLRYLRLVAVLTSGSRSSTPYIFDFVIGTQWISAVKDLGSTPSGWATLNANEIIGSNNTITLEMRSGASSGACTSATWYTVANNTIPSTVTLNEFIQYRVTMNTTDCMQIPGITQITQNYLKGSTSTTLPASASFKDRLYVSFMSNIATANDHTWVGQTKPDGSIVLDPSGYTGISYPAWSKCTFIGANVWGLYISQLIHGDSGNTGKVFYSRIGLTNNGSAYAASLTTKALGTLDRETIWRFLYVYSMASNIINIYYRTKRNAGGWSNWSSALSVAPSTDVSKSTKITLVGLNTSDFIQFMVTETPTDTLWSLAGMDIYGGAKNIR